MRVLAGVVLISMCAAVAVAAVRSGMEEGRSVEELQEAAILEPWEKWAGSYVSTDEWIEYIFDALQSTDGGEPKKDLYAELYYTLRDQGTEAAVARYLELKTKHAERYDFTEFTLLASGSKLLAKDRPEPAVAFLQLSTEEYPESDYLYYTYYLLAKAYLSLDQRQNALAACRKALELSPENKTIASVLSSRMPSAIVVRASRPHDRDQGRSLEVLPFFG
jgi:tetratricopeptide (TPR) repeat protein